MAKGTIIGKVKRTKGMLTFVDGDGFVRQTPMKRSKKKAAPKKAAVKKKATTAKKKAPAKRKVAAKRTKK